MCTICKEVAIAQAEVRTLLKEQQESGCKTGKLKAPERRFYHREYYQKHLAKKKADALARYYANKNPLRAAAKHEA